MHVSPPLIEEYQTVAERARIDDTYLFVSGGILPRCIALFIRQFEKHKALRVD
jgi:hypothetical protein